MATKQNIIPTILYINANNSEIGGADLCLVKMAVAIKEAGLQPIVILREETAIVELYNEYQIPVLVTPLVRLRGTASIRRKIGYCLQLPKTICMLYRKIRQLHPDLVHTNDFIDGAGNVAAWLAGVPSLQHFRMIADRPIWLVLFLKFLSSFSTRIICVSHAVQEKMVVNRFSHSQVLYDWLDMEAVGHMRARTSLHEELELETGTRLVGCVGRLEWWKGQRLFLEVADSIASDYPDVHFLLIGGPTTNKEWYLRDLQETRAQLQHGSRISILGHRTDMGSILDQLDIMVHTSILPEPFGLVVMEAMSRRTVVVAANGGGVPEQVTHGISGYLYEPGNRQDMARFLRIALDAKTPEEMKENALKAVEERFAKHRRAAELLEIYEALISSATLNK